MVSEESRHMLLTLTPLLLHLPPIVQTPQLLYSTTGTMDVDSTSVGVVSVAALAAMEIDVRTYYFF